jgi:cell division protein FtsI (penicillin-binding protein 3)
VGFFPANDPKYVCLILLDEPKTSGYGGYTAGPIFKNIAKRIAGLDNDIQRNLTIPEQKEKIFAQVPFLKGMTKPQARELLNELNLPYSITGTGKYVIEQNPESGIALQRGQQISLQLQETNIAQDSANVREGYAQIPDLTGMNMRKATHLLNELGLKAEIIGSGTVFAQYPRADEFLRKGYTVTIRGKAKSLELLTKAAK